MGFEAESELMDERTFREAMMNGEMRLECTFCGAIMWLAHAGDQLHLMREGTMHHRNCPICHEIHEMIS